jgi:hypothetical protein
LVLSLFSSAAIGLYTRLIWVCIYFLFLPVMPNMFNYHIPTCWPRAHFKPSRLSVFCFSSDVVGLHVLFEATILLGLCIIRTNDLKSIFFTGTRPSSNNKFQVCANGSCRSSVLKLHIDATMSHGLLHFKPRKLRSQYAYVICTFH